MSKKYRLKSEIVAVLNDHSKYKHIELTEDCWHGNGFSIGALEPVPSRVELENQTSHHIRKANGQPITKEERQLCEKALNGELFTKEDMESYACYWTNPRSGSMGFNQWFQERKK